MGVDADGSRELLGIRVVDSETEGLWGEFIASLKERGLTGVKLVVSDAHVGLTKAIRRQLQGCVWQRDKTHLVRNLLQRVSKGHRDSKTYLLQKTTHTRISLWAHKHE
jgi:putative transposase